MRQLTNLFMFYLKSNFAQKNHFFYPFGIYILIIITFVISTTNEQAILSQFSFAVIWFCTIFAVILSLNMSYEEDIHNGLLEQFFVHGISYELVVAAKLLCNWLTSGIILVVLLPLISYVLLMSNGNIFSLMSALLIGSLLLELISMLIATLTLSASSSTLLSCFLILPLTIPTLILGLATSNTQFLSEEFYRSFLAMLALLMIFLPLSLKVSAIALKLAIEEF